MQNTKCIIHNTKAVLDTRGQEYNFYMDVQKLINENNKNKTINLHAVEGDNDTVYL